MLLKIQALPVQTLCSELSPKQINKHIFGNINILLTVSVFKSTYPDTSAVGDFVYVVISII